MEDCAESGGCNSRTVAMFHPPGLIPTCQNQSQEVKMTVYNGHQLKVETTNAEVHKLCQMSAMPFVKHFKWGSADHTDNSVLAYIAGSAFCTSITHFVQSKRKSRPYCVQLSTQSSAWHIGGCAKE